MGSDNLSSYSKKALDFAARLVRVKSFSGQEREAIDLVAEEMRSLSYHSVKVDAVGNVVGSIYSDAPASGKVVLFDGHADTVGVTDLDAWTRDPFAGEIVDGRLYGRGALDMKASLAAMIYAGGYLASTGLEAGSVHVCCSVSEEVLEGAALTPVLLKLKPDYVIIGEPSSLQLVTAQRGRVELVIETTGIASHSSSPEKGVNAVDKMAELIPELYRLPVLHDPVLGPGILALTSIISSPYPSTSVIPNRCTATFDRRLTTGETAEEVMAQIRELFSRLTAGGRSLSAAVTAAHGSYSSYTGHTLEGLKVFPAWKMPPQSDLLSLCKDALTLCGIPVNQRAYRFCTNGSAPAAMGIPVIGFGPGDPEVAHLKDEYIPTCEVIDATRAYHSMATVLSRGSRQMQLI